MEYFCNGNIVADSWRFVNALLTAGNKTFHWEKQSINSRPTLERLFGRTKFVQNTRPPTLRFTLAQLLCLYHNGLEIGSAFPLRHQMVREPDRPPSHIRFQ